jgi:hypothetical protein
MLGAGLARADEGKGAEGAPADAKKAAAIAAWTKYMTPGEPHARLKAMVGEWKATSKSWSAPGAPPSDSEGKTTLKMVLGGRYLRQKYEGTLMGRTFRGVGYTGYDNARQKYAAMWIDDMGTGMMITEGTWDDSTKTLTASGEVPDFLSGGTKRLRTLLRFENENRILFEIHGPGPGGAEYKMIEVVYTR